MLRIRVSEGNLDTKCPRRRAAPLGLRCGKQYYRPGQRSDNLVRSEWTADILQVHHKNHYTTDNRLSNLLSVCAVCHLSLHRGRYSPVSEGQLSLW